MRNIYKTPEIDTYKGEWLQAERELAISGMDITDLLADKPGKSEETYTRKDFFRALKKASQRIEKPKPSPKRS